MMAGTSKAGKCSVTIVQQSDEIEELSDSIRQALECPVCMEVSPSLPEVCCSNGHGICVPCLEHMSLQQEVVSCPICRSPVTRTDTGRQLMTALPSIRIACRYRRHGCDALVPVTEVARHESGCWYLPDVRCMVTACNWLGTYDTLYEHVCSRHPDNVASEKGNRLLVTDVKSITTHRPGAYLAKTNNDSKLIWILIKRENLCRFRAGVFVVGSRQRDNGHPIDLVYRVTTGSQKNTRSVTHRAGRLNSSLLKIRGDNEGWSNVKVPSYDYLLKVGRLEVEWFVHECVKVYETRSRSRLLTAARAVQDATDATIGIPP